MAIFAGLGMVFVGPYDGADAEEFARALVGDDPRAGADLPKAPSLPRSGGSITLLALKFAHPPFEGRAIELRDIAELFPADGDIAVGLPLLPEMRVFTGADLPILDLVGIRVGIDRAPDGFALGGVELDDFGWEDFELGDDIDRLLRPRVDLRLGRFERCNGANSIADEKREFVADSHL